MRTSLISRLPNVPMVMLALTGSLVSANAQELTVSTLDPDSAQASAPAPALSRDEIERIFEIKEKIRERMAEGVVALPGTAALPRVFNRETDVVDAVAQYPGLPTAFRIGRNNRNTNANNAAKGSTLAEPAAGNEGARVLAAGNFNHAEHSANGGLTWTDINLGGGPADAPINCCDMDIVYDQSRGLWILSTLYINSSALNGVVRLFVFRTLPSAACSYTIDQAGTANNVLMDFPHIGLSNKFLYLATNDIGGTPSQSARMRRFNLDQMADCLTASFSTYSWPNTTEGQRVWRPVQGATDTIYWAHHSNSSTLRIFSWPETAAAPTNTTRILAATTFANPDCRGGSLNNDWTDSLWSHIVGFNLNGAVGRDNIAWFWNSAVTAGTPQAHSRGAIFNKVGLSLLAQPLVWNSAFCIGQISIAMNERGDIGATGSYGGRAGGTAAGAASAANGAVMMGDEYTAGLGIFGTLFQTIAGTHNRTDARHGDYFTIHQHEPCDMWFSATNYALNGGTALTNVNSRYVEFGRGRDEKCWLRWKDSLGTP